MLELAGVSKSYGAIQALAGIDLVVPKGMFGLLGPNGAGKSTLMRTVATLQTPDSGTIRFDGVDTVADPQSLRRRLGYLPQDFGVYPRTTAAALLKHLAVLKGVPAGACDERVDYLLARTNLADVRKQRIDTFSGGMRQRFGIAQALINDPELIIVDEPTAGLDPAERRRFHNLLSEIGEDVVVILSTHIVEDIAELCPRLAVMGGGRILCEGEPGALTRALEGRLWEQLVPRHALEEVRSKAQVVSTRVHQGRLAVRCLSGAPLPGMTAAAPSLEDVYFATLLEHGLEAEAA